VPIIQAYREKGGEERETVKEKGRNTTLDPNIKHKKNFFYFTVHEKKY
jgi:hypothetical protein